MPLAVRLRSAVCLLGRFPALAGADLDVEEGEAVLLSGPNGAGKTTLLRVLAGLLPLRSGSIEVLGADLGADRRAVRGQVGLVGHETFCYDDMTVRENLAFAARAAGGDPRRVDEAVAQATDRTGLGALAGVTHARLSAGQRRRCALAAALVRSPRLLLLDEPHAGLDHDGRVVLDGVVRAAVQERTTVVLASHEVERARALCGRELRVDGGRTFPVAPAATAAPARPDHGAPRAVAEVRP